MCSTKRNTKHNRPIALVSDLNIQNCAPSSVRCFVIVWNIPTPVVQPLEDGGSIPSQAPLETTEDEEIPAQEVDKQPQVLSESEDELPGVLF